MHLSATDPPRVTQHRRSTQPIRRLATATLYLGRRFGRKRSQCLQFSVCRADPTIPGKSVQRPKVQVGAVASLPCRLLGCDMEFRRNRRPLFCRSHAIPRRNRLRTRQKRNLKPTLPAHDRKRARGVRMLLHPNLPRVAHGARR